MPVEISRQFRNSIVIIPAAYFRYTVRSCRYVRTCRLCRESERAVNIEEIRQILAPYPEMLTVDEVAAVLRVHPRSIQRWAREGRVTTVRVGRSYRIPRSDVLRWLLDATTPALVRRHRPHEELPGQDVGATV